MKKNVEILRVKLADNLFGAAEKKTRDEIKAVKGVFNVLSFGGALNTVLVEYNGHMSTAAQVRRVPGVKSAYSN